MRCEDAAAAATDLSEDGLGPLRALRVRRHYALCASCRCYAEQLETAGRAASVLADEALDPGDEAQALSTFRSWQARRKHLPQASARRQASAGIAAVVAAVAGGAIASVAMTAHRAPLGTPWLLAGLLTALACALVPMAPRRGLLVVAVAVAAATVPIALMQRAAPALPLGLPCVLHELLTAALALAAVALFWRDAGARSRSSLAGVAALGALAGDASLHVACASAESIEHLLAFHVGGVALAAALGGTIVARWLQPRRVTP